MFRWNLLIFFLALALAPLASAQDVDLLNEPYVGFGYGQYKFEFEGTGTDTDFDDNQEALRIFGGFQFTDALAGEISYYDFDDAEDTGFASDLEGASIAALFSAPLHERFSLFAKVGWFWWEADVETTIPGDPVLSQDFDGDDIFFGLGARLGLTDAMHLRVEYDRFDIDEEINPDLDYASVGLQFNF